MTTSIINNNAAINENTTLGELIAILGNVQRLEKSPKTKQLREECGEPIAKEERCKVYRNGYAVYDNDSGYTVLWVPGCTSFTYRFDPMKDSEKGDEIKETFELPEGYLETLPWAIALTLIGDHRIETLSMQRKGDRKQNRSYIRGDNEEGDAQDETGEREASLKKEYIWHEEQFGENPEDICIRRERQLEALESMTAKQREVFVLYYQEGYNQREIGEMLGLARTTVMHRLEEALKKVKKIYA